MTSALYGQVAVTGIEQYKTD